jgi:L-seryl-tRNA(Ser) seleniumtransferase
LRNYNPPIIARIEEDLLLFDPRTVFPEEEETLLRGIEEAISKA